MLRSIAWLMLVSAGVQAAQSFARAPGQLNSVSTIGFGSCLKQNKPLPILSQVLDEVPDLFMFLGDNVYADTTDMDRMRETYSVLGRHPDYTTLQNHVPIVATWDDHDYGENDAGAEYSKKVEAQEIFLDFFEEPQDSPRRNRPGIYTSYVFGSENRRVQVIVLDTRYFRSPLIRGENRRYVENRDPGATILGGDQWAFLEAELRKDADVRFILTSIQFVAQEHRYEKWQNFPLERQRLLDLIDTTGAAGVIFLSGDRHQHELSKLVRPGRYPLYDFTSSGLNNGRNNWPEDETNQHRLGLGIGNAYGLIKIDWAQTPVRITMTSKSIHGDVQFQEQVFLTDLQP